MYLSVVGHDLEHWEGAADQLSQTLRSFLLSMIPAGRTLNVG